MDPHAQQPRSSGNRTCLIVIVIFMVLGLGTCATCGVAAYFGFKYMWEQLSKPIEQFSAAIEKGEYTVAYNQLSGNYRSQVAEEDFTAFIVDHKSVFTGTITMSGFEQSATPGSSVATVTANVNGRELSIDLIQEGQRFLINRIGINGGATTPGYFGKTLRLDKTLKNINREVRAEQIKIEIKVESRGGERKDGMIRQALDCKLLFGEDVLLEKSDMVTYQGDKSPVTWTVTLTLPANISAEEHQLVLTVRDLVSGTSAQQSYPIRFQGE